MVAFGLASANIYKQIMAKTCNESDWFVVQNFFFVAVIGLLVMGEWELLHFKN